MSMNIKMGSNPDEKDKEYVSPMQSKENDIPSDAGGNETDTNTDQARDVDVSDKADSGRKDDESTDQGDDKSFDLESLDPKLEVWPGGPTVGQTLAWKAEFGEVYTTSLTMDFHVMWRPITRDEYKKHVRQMEELSQSGRVSSNVDLNMIQEELLTEMCLLHPKLTRSDMNKELAGLPSIIAQQVMEASGFSALEVRQI